MEARAFSAVTLALFFYCGNAHGFSQTAKDEVLRKNNDSLFSLIEDRLEIKVGEYVNSFTKYLENFNDKHLGASAFGRFLHYDEIKPKLETGSARAARMKKMAMAMMPLVFHVGATSTWMMLTAIMATKSVMIGLALLIFKIAVSSAKLAAFFTKWKGHEEHHHGWSWSPPPHHEYHGHDRSLSDIAHIEHSDHHPTHTSPDWHSYSPEWTPNDNPHDYHTIPSSYKEVKEIDVDKDNEYHGPYLHAEERIKKALEKKKFT